MPKAEVGSWQNRAIQELGRAVSYRPEYRSAQDDHYSIGSNPIFAYIKAIVENPRSSMPPGGLKVIVNHPALQLFFDELEKGNDWFGSPSWHMYVAKEDKRSLERAKDLIRRAHAKIEGRV